MCDKKLSITVASLLLSYSLGLGTSLTLGISLAWWCGVSTPFTQHSCKEPNPPWSLLRRPSLSAFLLECLPRLPRFSLGRPCFPEPRHALNQFVMVPLYPCVECLDRSSTFCSSRSSCSLTSAMVTSSFITRASMVAIASLNLLPLVPLGGLGISSLPLCCSSVTFDMVFSNNKRLR